jgi:hypothetical protein
LDFRGNIIRGNIIRGNIIRGNIVRGNIIRGIDVVPKINHLATLFVFWRCCLENKDFYGVASLGRKQETVSTLTYSKLDQLDDPIQRCLPTKGRLTY